MTTYEDPKPELGMGATEICWSDRHAYTVVGILPGNAIMVRRDKVTALRTEHGVSVYKYEEDPDGPTRVLTKRKNGAWIVKGEGLKGTRFRLGIRDEHYDPHF